jgi:hypothetical protein
MGIYIGIVMAVSATMGLELYPEHQQQEAFAVVPGIKEYEPT